MCNALLIFFLSPFYLKRALKVGSNAAIKSSLEALYPHIGALLNARFNDAYHATLHRDVSRIWDNNGIHYSLWMTEVSINWEEEEATVNLRLCAPEITENEEE